MYHDGYYKVLVVLGLGLCALGCGPAVHNEAAERARQWFSNSATTGRVAEYGGILERHPKSLQAGVVFPDWGYGCLSMDEEAETAHWTPFLRHGVTYVQQRYSKPYSERAEQVIAFLFGVASHQVADEQWHSLGGLRDGIMATLANSTFGGEYSRAHDALDVGGDFALAHMSDLGYILDKWTVPVDDVLEIYRAMGVRVTKWKMNLCVTRQFYAMEAVKRFGQGLFPSYASRAPILTERIEDYYIGGLYAMATGTYACWGLFAEWFESGDYSKGCLVEDRRHRHEASGSAARAILDYMWPGGPMMDQEGVGSVVLSEEHSGALHLRIDRHSEFPQPQAHSRTTPDRHDSRQHAFGGERQQTGNGTAEKCGSLGTVFPKIKRLYTSSAYSGFGTAVVTGDFSGSGNPSVAISAPYFMSRDSGTDVGGAVFVVDGGDVWYEYSQQDVFDAGALVLRPESDEQAEAAAFPVFGSSLAVVDLNADGIDDLAVGSSGYGRDSSGRLLGRVDVYLGRRGLGLSSRPDYTLTAEQLAQHMDGGKWSRQRIGGFLFGEDVDNDGFADLVIGAPYNSEGDTRRELHTGRVFVYLASKQTADERRRGGLGRPDISVAAPVRQSYEWFGFSVRSVFVDELDASLLLVGAPGHRVAEENGGGWHELAGRVYAYRVVGQRGLELLDVELGTRKDLTQLGSHMHVWRRQGGGAGPLILLGSPSEHSYSSSKWGMIAAAAAGEAPERGWQAGEVRVMDPAAWGGRQVGGGEELAGLVRILSGMQSPGHFGRGLASSTATGDVWIGEPFGGGEAGRVYRWSADAAEPQCFGMADGGHARLGQTIRAASGAGVELLAVSAPHDSQFSRLAGSVLLMHSRAEPS